MEENSPTKGTRLKPWATKGKRERRRRRGTLEPEPPFFYHSTRAYTNFTLKCVFIYGRGAVSSNCVYTKEWRPSRKCLSPGDPYEKRSECRRRRRSVRFNDKTVAADDHYSRRTTISKRRLLPLVYIHIRGHACFSELYAIVRDDSLARCEGDGCPPKCGGAGRAE